MRISFDSSIEAAKRAARAAKLKALKALESPGRKHGAVVGSWVTDLAEIRQSIALCWQCNPKFKPIARRYGYTPIQRFTDWYGGAWANCDACRQWGPQRTAWVHDSNRDYV